MRSLLRLLAIGALLMTAPAVTPAAQAATVTVAASPVAWEWRGRPVYRRPLVVAPAWRAPVIAPAWRCGPYPYRYRCW